MRLGMSSPNELPEVGAVLGEGNNKDIQPHRVYLLNAISTSMFPESALIYTKPVDIGFVRTVLSQGFISAIGHQSTAQLLTQLLGIKVEANRVAVQLKEMDRAIVVGLKFRPEEGKVYSLEELSEFLQRELIQFHFVEVVADGKHADKVRYEIDLQGI